jgi:hypothetical protein
MIKLSDLNKETKEKIFGKNNKGDIVNDVIESAKSELVKLAKDKKNKSAAIGAGIGYLISNEETRTRNAIIGGLIGYFLGSKEESEE